MSEILGDYFCNIIMFVFVKGLFSGREGFFFFILKFKIP